METINWHLNSRGFFIESNTIDISVFDYHLREIVGNVADNVLEVVYKSLEKQLHLANGGTLNDDHNQGHHGKNVSKDDSMVEKIQQLMVVASSAQEDLR